MAGEIKNIPQHIALIPDGNRRWARKRLLKPWAGHKQGITAFENVLEKSLELKIPCLTFWGSSWDNLTKRPKIEVNFLLKLYNEQFGRIAKDKRIHENKVRINIFGRWKDILPQDTQKIIEKAVETTKNYNQFSLNFLLAYSGLEEMADCVQKIADLGKGKNIKVSQEMIKNNLWTGGLPPVDLLIRTGCEGDPHLSAGFMMWQTAYSQLHFTRTFFPDFGPAEFEKIIKDYSERERRFGG